MSDLFSEFTIKGKIIKNRVVMPPMVCFGWAGNTGHVSGKHIAHYEARARGGVGLIIIEATCVSPDGRLSPDQLGLWSDDFIEGLKRLVDVCHGFGTKVLVQIHHAGANTHKDVSDIPLSSSDFNKKDRNVRAMTLEEIKRVQNDFVKAAVRAEKAGFDGVELHGAHGYLISQFVSPLVNKRTDNYGGELSNRLRFPLEIIRMIKEQVGKDFILGYRMGGNEPGLEEGKLIARELESHGVDLLHVSSGISSGVLPEVPAGFPYNWIVYCGTEIKKVVNIPVIVVNGIKKPDEARFLLQNNLADFTAIGRSLLVDPEWANKARDKVNADPCLQCSRCIWFIDGTKCPGIKKRNNV